MVLSWATVMGRPLARQVFFPSADSSRDSSSVPSSSGATPFSVRAGRFASTWSNAALTKAFAAPERIRSRDVR